jgi:FkbM family methyltransferase
MPARTAFKLLAERNWPLLVRRLRRRVRMLRLQRIGSRPFAYNCAGDRLMCFPQHPDSVNFYLEPQLVERPEMTLLRAWLTSGDTFVDGGANLGTYTALAGAVVGPSGRVLACEPDPALAARIELQASLLGHTSVRVVPTALGAATGSAQLWLARDGAGHGYQSLRPPLSGTGSFVPAEVSVRTLDEVVAEHSAATPPAALKLDIEGAEALALSGASRLLAASDRALWLVELGAATLQAFGATPADVLRHFPADAYEGWVFAKHVHGGPDAPPPRPLQPDEKFADAVYHNVALLPRSGQFAARRARLPRACLPPGLPVPLR